MKGRYVFCILVVASFFYATRSKPYGLKNDSNKTNFEEKNKRILQSDDTNGEYLITWTINLKEQNSLLDSPYLKASFEQIMKDFINKEIKCEGELEDSSTSFYSFEIIDGSRTKKDKIKIAGSGKCKGRAKRCRRNIKETVSDAGRSPNIFDISNNTKPRNNFCETFGQTSLFDSFKYITTTASFFNYNVDVGVIEDILGNLELDYNVEFVSSVGDGLDQIKEVIFDEEDVVEVSTTCVEPECSIQKSVMEQILSYFNVPLIENQHECVYEGVNCDQNDKVINIWIG